MPRDEGTLIAGYEAEIHRALWQRILISGVPRLWFIVPLVISIFVAFSLFLTYQSLVAGVPLLIWGVVFLGLKALTRWDRDFDAVLLSSLRYRSFYDAG
jgi:type IV secretory pathway TrbD component